MQQSTSQIQILWEFELTLLIWSPQELLDSFTYISHINIYVRYVHTSSAQSRSALVVHVFDTYLHKNGFYRDVTIKLIQIEGHVVDWHVYQITSLVK